MAACRYEISLLVLKNISLVRCAHSRNNSTLEGKFLISAGCNILYFHDKKHTETVPATSNKKEAREGRFMWNTVKFSLRKQPFLIALGRWERFAWRNVSDSATKIPY